MIKLIYIAVLVILSTVAVAQEVKAIKTPEQIAHEDAVIRNRKTAKKLKAQHKRAHKLKSLKRDKSDILKPRFRPHPKEVQEAIERKGRRYQPRRVSRPVVE